LLQVGNLLCCFLQIVAVKRAIREHRVVKRLLHLELRFSIQVFLLELGNQVFLQFDLLKALIVLGVGLRRLDTVLFFLLFKCEDLLVETPGLSLEARLLVL
jgi:hypothetical protein